MREFLGILATPYKVEEDIKGMRNGISILIIPE